MRRDAIPVRCRNVRFPAGCASRLADSVPMLPIASQAAAGLRRQTLPGKRISHTEDADQHPFASPFTIMSMPLLVRE